MAKEITITNQAEDVAIIEIEGTIGVPERWQFEEPGQRIATYDTFRIALESIKTIKAKEVIVNIRSTGGNVNDALLIYDALSGLGVTIITRCFGYAASAATIIAQAASAGRREISANSLYLIHKSVCSTEGNSQQLEQTLDMLGKTDQRIAALYAARSDRKVSEFVALMSENNGNGRWLSPEETIAFALADKVIPSSPITADARETVACLGLPPIPKKRRHVSDEVSKKWNAILKTLSIHRVSLNDTEGTFDPTESGSEQGKHITNSEMREPLDSDKQSERSEIETGSNIKDSVCEKNECHGYKSHHDEIVIEFEKQAKSSTGEIETTISANSIDVQSEYLQQDSASEKITAAKSTIKIDNRYQTLETMNARLSALPTTTLSKEDPSVQDMRLSSNETAYMEDLRNFI